MIEYDNKYHTPHLPLPNLKLTSPPSQTTAWLKFFGFCEKKQEQARTLINGSKTRLRPRRCCFTKKC